jgi:hypothetical protein
MTHASGGRRDDDGIRNMDDESTRIVFRNDGGNDQETRILSDRVPGGLGGAGRDGAGTVIGVADIQKGVRVAGQPVRSGLGHANPPPSNTGETIFVRGTGVADVAGQAFDPVVGWLVVRTGPGRGQSLPVYYGQSSIGRGEDQRIRLDFGDQRISREAHAFIIYDDNQRRFFIRDNGKTNLVRLNGNIVMTPTEIHDREELTIGDTKLMFVALCGPAFDWLADNDSSAT